MVNHNFERDELPRYLKNNYLKSNDLNIAEIGVLNGDYAQTIKSAFLEAKLHLIDIWQTEGNDFYYSIRKNDTENAYLKALGRFKDDNKCFFYKEKSSEACKRFPDNFFDLIYIDADHSYDGVKNDILSWLPKIKIGGFICGHDFDPDLEMPEGNIFGVNKAVTEIFKDKIDKVCLTNEPYFKSWFIQK